MATSPVRIRKDDKDQLERLRGALARSTGEKPTQQETIHLAIEFIARHKEDFLATAVWRPMDEQTIERWLSKNHDLGDWTTDDIDDILYGEHP